MHPGYGLPVTYIVCACLSAGLDLSRSRWAALRALSATRRERYGRFVMNRSRMVVAWTLTGLTVLCALYYAYVGSPAWWLWLVAVAAQLGVLAVRVRVRTRFESYLAAMRGGAATAP